MQPWLASPTLPVTAWPVSTTQSLVLFSFSTRPSSTFLEPSIFISHLLVLVFVFVESIILILLRLGLQA